MRFGSARGSRVAYCIYAVLSILVLSILAWTTEVSLRLERADQLNAIHKEHDNTVRLAIYRMDNLAGAMLSTELRREYWHFTPFYYPNRKHVRFANGAIFKQGAIVQPSPLLLAPPPEWILLHFQVSPRAWRWRSPQLLPDKARDWPGVEDAYDTWNRQPFERMLRALEFSYSCDELATAFERAATYHAEAMHGALPDDGSQRQPPPASIRASGKRLPQRSDYRHRRATANLLQKVQTPNLACEPQNLAIANIHSPDPLGGVLATDAFADDEEVGITYQPMRPVWLKLAEREQEDLALLRTIEVDGETAIQGCLIDWPALRSLLLDRVVDLFPDATLDSVEPANWPGDDPVLSSIPARLVTNAAAQAVGAMQWNSTHTALAIAWLVSVVLLGGLGLGIRSQLSLSERRSQFACTVAHELRTPLTTFRLYTDMLAQGLVRDEDKQEYLNTLNNESRRLADLVSGVLEYSRVENNSVSINALDTSIREILDTIREQYEDRCTQSDMTLSIDTGDVADDAIHTDRQLVVQIVGNLVDNARKYGRSHNGAPIRISAGRANGFYHIDVSDQGPGIASRNRSTIFKPYRRGDADPTTIAGGLGLGLALSRSWAELIGGQLELRPSDHGAVFRFTFPGAGTSD